MKYKKKEHFSQNKLNNSISSSSSLKYTKKCAPITIGSSLLCIFMIAMVLMPPEDD